MTDEQRVRIAETVNDVWERFSSSDKIFNDKCVAIFLFTLIKMFEDELPEPNLINKVLNIYQEDLMKRGAS